MFPSLANTSKLKGFFNVLKSITIPDKFTFRFLAKLGYSSSQDRSLLNLLQFLGFIDNKASPTKAFFEYKDYLKSSEILGNCVQVAYKTVFSSNEQAHSLSRDYLLGIFNGLQNVDEKTVSKQVDTFMELCSLAYFTDTTTLVTSSVHVPVKSPTTSKVSTPININLTVNLSSTEDFEGFFKNLKELLTLEN